MVEWAWSLDLHGWLPLLESIRGGNILICLLETPVVKWMVSLLLGQSCGTWLPNTQFIVGHFLSGICGTYQWTVTGALLRAKTNVKICQLHTNSKIKKSQISFPNTGKAHVPIYSYKQDTHTNTALFIYRFIYRYTELLYTTCTDAWICCTDVHFYCTSVLSNCSDQWEPK